MSYYKFKPATNTKETGAVYPQIQEMSPGYNYKAENSVHALSKYHSSFPEHTPNLDYFIIHNKAKPTDLLSVAVIYGGFLISTKLKKLLEKFNLPIHKFYNARVLYKNEYYEYYWMHVICNLTDIVDYSASSFFVYHNYSHNLGYIDLLSYEDLTKKKVKIKADNPGKTITIWAEKIVLANSFNEKLDLFQVGSFDSDTYISEELKKAIENEKITGVHIEKTNKIIII